MIARRALLATTAVLGASLGNAQEVRAPGKIGYLHPRSADPDTVTRRVLRPVWQRLGYIEGESFLSRGAGGDHARLAVLARELAAAGVGVLIAVGPATVRAAHEALPGMPIVAIDLETVPVRAGFAQSFARPGGMVTGLFLDQASLAEKWVSLLREAVPSIERLAIVWDPTTTRDQLESALQAARAMRLDASVVELYKADQVNSTFERMGDMRGLGIVHLGSPGFATIAERFAAAAIRHSVPTISFLRAYAVAGLLMTYGVNQEIFFPRAVTLADRILRGEKPGTIPIERPSRFEFVVNARTAAALGLTLASTFLAQTDEVIE